jgi:uncharacterized protein (TIGR02598 family)
VFSKKKKSFGRRSSAGFTLIEVVLAALILLTGLVGVIQVISSGVQMLDVSRKQAVAMRIIHSEIDKLRLYNWTKITSLPLSPTSIPSSETAVVDTSRDPLSKTLFYDSTSALNTSDKLRIVEVESPVDSSFTCTRLVENVAGENSLRKITFTVTWQTNNGRSYSRSSFTYFGKNGLYVAFQRS